MMALHSAPLNTSNLSSHYRNMETEDLASPTTVLSTCPPKPPNRSTHSSDLIPISSLKFYIDRTVASKYNHQTAKELVKGITNAGGTIEGEVSGGFDPTLVFVLCHFKGSMFETLVLKNRMVIGVDCLRGALQKGGLPPTIKRFPIFSSMLEDEVITTTGFEDKDREIIERKVVSLGGKFLHDLKREVTVLLAAPTSLNSAKCIMARKLRQPIVSLEWLEKCDEQGEKLSTRDFEITPPIFKDCTIVVSGYNFEARRREMMTQLIQLHGGTYQSNLPLRGLVTHLIVDETTGTKYEHADRCQVQFIVNSKWFFDSIENGIRLNEEGYLMPRPSEVLGRGRGVQEAESNQPRMEEVLVQDSHEGRTTNALQTTSTDEDEENFDMFLDGCLIFLSSQFNKHKKERLSRAVRMIREGGGTRLPEYNNNVTHFVVPSPPNTSSTCVPPSLSDSDIRALTKFNKTPYVVSEKWLVNSHSSKKLLPPDEYLIPLPFTFSSESQSSNASAAFVIPPGISSSALDSQAAVSPMLDGDEDSKQSISAKSQSLDSSEDAEDQDDTRPFARVHIYAFGFGLEEIVEIRDVVGRLGGSVTDATTEPRRSKHNYFLALHGFIEEAKEAQMEISRTNRSVPPLVSTSWIERCVEEQRLLDHKRNVLFTPVPHELPMEFMSLFFICIADFDGEEKREVQTMIKFSGARPQSKVTSKTSHLLCKGSDSKEFKRARELGVATVSLSWLEECLLTGKHQLETSFLVGGRLSRDDDNRQDLQNNYSEGEEGDENDINQLPLKQTDSRKRRKKGSGRKTDEQGNRSSINSVPKSFWAPEASEFNVLAGVTVYITKSVPQSSLSGLQSDVRSLGGDYVCTFNATSVTHIVHQGKVENSKEFKAAKTNPEIKIVSPLWVLECKKARKRLPEDGFPFKMNPNMNLELSGPPKSSSTSKKSIGSRPNYILPPSSQGSSSSISRSSLAHSRSAGRLPELSLVNSSALSQDEPLSQSTSSQRAKITLVDQMRHIEARRASTSSVSSGLHRSNPSGRLQFQSESNDEVTTNPPSKPNIKQPPQPPKKTTDQHLFARFDEEMRVAGVSPVKRRDSSSRPSIDSTLSLSLKSASLEDGKDDHLVVVDRREPQEPTPPSPFPAFQQVIQEEEEEEEEEEGGILPMMTGEDDSEPVFLYEKEPERAQPETSETQKEASALLSEMEQLFESDEKQTVFPHLSALRHSSATNHDSFSLLRASDSSHSSAVGGRHRHISRSELESDELSQRFFGEGTPRSNRRRSLFSDTEETSLSQEEGEEEEGRRREELLSLDIRIRYTDMGDKEGNSPGPQHNERGKRKTPPMASITSASTTTTSFSSSSSSSTTPTNKRICIDLSDEDDSNQQQQQQPTTRRSALPVVAPTSPGLLPNRRTAGQMQSTSTSTSTTTSTSTSNTTTPNTSTRNSPINISIPTSSSSSSSSARPKIFAISGLLDDPLGHQKERMTRVIKRLGGVVVDEVTAETTHLIAGNIVRSHKTLASIILGNWILKPDYVWESEKQGRFLPEDSYEWTPSEAADESKKLLLAYNRSKQVKSTGGNLIFKGWRVALMLSSEKQKLYRTLMEFGGATVTLVDPKGGGGGSGGATTATGSGSLVNDLVQDKKVNYVFVEKFNVSKDHKRLEELTKAGVKVLVSAYITEAIVGDPVPTFEKFYWQVFFKKMNSGTNTGTGAGGASSTTAIATSSNATSGVSTKGSTTQTNSRKKW